MFMERESMPAKGMRGKNDAALTEYDMASLKQAFLPALILPAAPFAPASIHPPGVDNHQLHQ